MVIFLETVWSKHPSLFHEGEVRLSDLLEVVWRESYQTPGPGRMPDPWSHTNVLQGIYMIGQ